MRVQLWSYNYDPEPTGIGPVSKTLAEALRDRGHEVVVVAAHPHYPEPLWGRRVRPYRERRQGVPVLRLPLLVGRGSAGARYRQEISFMLSQAAASTVLPSADVVVSASPCFPALLPAIGFVRARGVPWVLWLHDILPEGAATTGLVDEGLVLASSRWLERTAYAQADRIVVLSRAFMANLEAKGVPGTKLRLIYDPATRTPQRIPEPHERAQTRILSMGNVGVSQGLAPLARAFDADLRMADIDAKLIITGTGVASDDVRLAIQSDRVEMRGVVGDEEMERQLEAARIGLVTQRYSGSEFNLPSKLMNFMAYGLPVLAAVNPGGEVARMIAEAGSGWVVDSSTPRALPDKIVELVADPAEIERAARASYAFAEKNFTQRAFADAFGAELEDVRRVFDRRDERYQKARESLPV